jgi:hypothetical protein
VTKPLFEFTLAAENIETATMARGYSLKLLDSRALVYAYSIMFSTLEPMLAVISAWYMVGALRRRKLLKALRGLRWWLWFDSRGYHLFYSGAWT